MLVVCWGHDVSGFVGRSEFEEVGDSFLRRDRRLEQLMYFPKRRPRFWWLIGVGTIVGDDRLSAFRSQFPALVVLQLGYWLYPATVAPA